MLIGLPIAEGYDLVVKPLRYRTRPHLAGFTDFASQIITLQVPEPFLPFGEVIYFGAKRKSAKPLRFIWLSEGLTFRTLREVLRFVYCHEWMHWYLKEQLGRKGAAETACDRFALWNYQRPRVDVSDADGALRRQRPAGAA